MCIRDSSSGPARFAVNQIASAENMAGEAIAGSPPAIGNSPTNARIAATIAKMGRTGLVDPSASGMVPPRRCRKLVVAEVEASI